MFEYLLTKIIFQSKFAHKFPNFKIPSGLTHLEYQILRETLFTPSITKNIRINTAWIVFVSKENYWDHKMFVIWLPITLKTIAARWTVRRNPVRNDSHSSTLKWSTMLAGRMWSVSEVQPPSRSIQEPASSRITAHVESTTGWIISNWPCLTHSQDKAEEMVRKLIIFPQVMSGLSSVRPMVSTKTGAFSASVIVKVMLENVLGLIRSSSTAVRLRMAMTWRSDELGSTSINIEIFLVNKPSRRNFSLTTWAQILWI